MYCSSCILVLFVLFAYAQSFNQPENKTNHVKSECAAETGYDTENPDRHYKNNVPDHIASCYHTCYAINAGLLTANGRLNIKFLVSEISPNAPDKEKLIEDIQKCARLKGKDMCKVGVKVLDCCYDKQILKRIEEGRRNQAAAAI